MITDKSKDKIAAMFNSIAPSYDLLNHLLSMGIDKIWRRRVVKIIKGCGAKKILDIAAGTGDLSIAMARNIADAQIHGVDISEGMLAVARDKAAKKRLSGKITFTIDDALCLSYVDNSFDALTVAFGVRNFENLELGLSEMLRVVKPKATIVVLELSIPTNPIFRGVYNFYFTKILPLIGKATSKSDFAYKYLPQSVTEFPSGDKFLSLMCKVGYVNCKKRELCGAIATIYSAEKH
ncbi:MAG: bifunctional demethylmenaquinone methyltransferase/2-methoxy-6-polyprenyl-1,4-benzoquinol methylase UbiE [Rikenellaceae bacterium]